MPAISITTDADALTLTATGAFPVPLERLWAAWADPRQLERFWGPPEWPATFTHHDLRPGGRAEYHMTGPDGAKVRGYWTFERVDPPHAFEVLDGFADADGAASEAMPQTRMRVTFEATPSGSSPSAPSPRSRRWRSSWPWG